MLAVLLWASSQHSVAESELYNTSDVRTQASSLLRCGVALPLAVPAAGVCPGCDLGRVGRLARPPGQHIWMSFVESPESCRDEWRKTAASSWLRRRLPILQREIAAWRRLDKKSGFCQKWCEK